MDQEATSGGILVRNGHERTLPAGWVEALAHCGRRALEVLEREALQRRSPPEMVQVTLVDDAEITRVHGEFLSDPTATDVITFDYGETGELVVSIDTAERQGAEFGATLERELALYLVHGLLHLCGYSDHETEERENMSRLQERLVGECFDPPARPRV